MSQRVAALEQEIDRLTEGAELENVSLLPHASCYLSVVVQTGDVLFCVCFHLSSCSAAEARKAAPGVGVGEGRT